MPGDGESQSGAGPEDCAPESTRRRGLTWWIPTATFLLALSLYAHQLTLSAMPAFYDSGVYIAATLNWIGGMTPYSGFTFVNPPGLLYLLVPAALFGKLFGSHVALVIGRWMSVTVTATVVGLVSRMMRHRGVTAMAVSGGLLAVTPVVDTVSSAVKLDAYCVLFCLLGVNLVLDKLSDVDGMREDRPVRWWLSGVLFGFAGAIKLWAIFPFLAFAICVVVWRRSRLAAMILGAGLGFLVPSLPFLLADPSHYFHQVIADQLFQPNLAGTSPGSLFRLQEISGFAFTTAQPSSLVLVVGICIVLLALVATVLLGPRLQVEEAFFLLSTLFVTGALLVAPVWDLYYAYFDAPFIAAVFAIVAVRLVRLLGPWIRRQGVSRLIQRFGFIGLGLVAMTIVVKCILLNMQFFEVFSTSGFTSSDLAAIRGFVPRSSCVVYTYVYEGVATDRLAPVGSPCSAVVDSYGMFQSAGMNFEHPPSTIVREWAWYFRKAQFVVLNAPDTPYVPWTRQLEHSFKTRYRLVSASPGVYIYQNRADGY